MNRFNGRTDIEMFGGYSNIPSVPRLRNNIPPVPNYHINARNRYGETDMTNMTMNFVRTFETRSILPSR